MGRRGPAGGTSACVGTPVVTPKRVVRLSEHQLFSSYTSLFGASAAATITRNEDPPSLLEREFPPISGDIGVSEGLLGKYDRLAQSAMSYVSRERGHAHPVRGDAVGQGVRPGIPAVLRREGVSPSAQRRRTDCDHRTAVDGDGRRGRHARGGARLRGLRRSQLAELPLSDRARRRRRGRWTAHAPRARRRDLPVPHRRPARRRAARRRGLEHARARPTRSAPRRRACSRRPRRAPTSRARSSSTSLSPGRRPWS